MTGQGRSSGNPLRTFLRRFLLCFALVIAAAPCSPAAAGTTVVQPALTAAATAIHAYDLLPRRVAARLGSDAGGADQWRNEQRDTAELPRAPSLGSPLRQQFVIAAEDAGPALTRVGRWMGSAEHDAMSATNTVQEGAGGVTSVAHPADPEAFMRQDSSGSRYVEFDVPADALSPGGKAGWASIRGPNSWWASYGKALPEMPSAFNIEWLASRL